MNLFELFVTIKAVDQASVPVEALTAKMKKDLPDAAGAGSKAVIGSTGAIVTAVSTAVSAIAKLVKSSITEFAEYEQLVGGVDTLFKDSAGKIKSYADQAYLTAGMSANEYMETITSFSASLLQSLEGDTDKAAEISNQAIVDMSDNVNKMGTDMAMVRNAYQGFARQNFMMLDNLRLGYAGTKTEMQRLIDDANKIRQANGEMADLSIESFADMVEAIHVIQTEMGITGTTAVEASTTIQGSISSMNAAWKNLITGIGNNNKDIDKLMDDFFTAFDTAMNNIEPVLEKFFERLPEIIAKATPKLIKAARELIAAILVGLIKSIPELVDAFIEDLLDEIVSPTNKSQSESAGKELGNSLLKGLFSVFTINPIKKILDYFFGKEKKSADKKAYESGYESGKSYSNGFSKGITESTGGIIVSDGLLDKIKAGNDASSNEEKANISNQYTKSDSLFGNLFGPVQAFTIGSSAADNIRTSLYSRSKNSEPERSGSTYTDKRTNNYNINITTTTSDPEEMAKVIRREIESIDIRRGNAYGMA